MKVAWPTLAVAVGSFGLVGLAVGGFGTGRLSGLAALGLGCFAAFTPVHEAAHGNVAASRTVNDLVGHLCAGIVVGALGPYRVVHGAHHRYTDDPVRDPDAALVRGPGWAWPLRFAFHDLAYLRFYLARWEGRPRPERAELVAMGLVLAAVLVGASASGWLAAVLWGWLLPTRIAVFLLAWTFAWVPHASEVGYRNHRQGVLTWLLLGQTFHDLHHQRPDVPFYAWPGRFRTRQDSPDGPAKAPTASAAVSRMPATRGTAR